MNTLDWLLAALIALAFILAVRKTVRDAKKGKGCMGSCSGCAGCGRGSSCPASNADKGDNAS